MRLISGIGLAAAVGLLCAVVYRLSIQMVLGSSEIGPWILDDWAVSSVGSLLLIILAHRIWRTRITLIAAKSMAVSMIFAVSAFVWLYRGPQLVPQISAQSADIVQLVSDLAAAGVAASIAGIVVLSHGFRRMLVVLGAFVAGVLGAGLSQALVWPSVLRGTLESAGIIASPPGAVHLSGLYADHLGAYLTAFAGALVGLSLFLFIAGCRAGRKAVTEA